MKKSLIALAVAAVAATPMAASAAMLQAADEQEGIDLYGSFRAQFQAGADNEINDGYSRWGIQGSHDLGNGQSSFYRMEQGLSTVTADLGGRLGYVGLKGGWGALAGGRQWTPYYSTVAGPSDIFAGGGVANYTGPGRAGNVVSYSLPTGMVIGGAVAFVANGDVFDAEGNLEEAQEDVDAVSLGLTANAGPVTFGLGVHDDSATNRTRVGLSVGGNFGPVGATFMVEDTDPQEGDGGSTPWHLTLTGWGFAYQYSDGDLDNLDSAANTLGYTYKLSGNTRIQLTYQTKKNVDDDVFTARYRVDF